MSGLRRSVHFVPGASERMLGKALATAADALVLDLEDAVTPDHKDAARAEISRWLAEVDFGRQERIVRFNPLDTPWGEADLAATMVHPPDAYLVPKVRSRADIDAIDALLTAHEQAHGHPPGQVELIVIATETPQGVLALPTLAEPPRVTALSWGAEDLSAAIGARRNRDADGRYLDLFLHCRTMTLVCAHAAGVQPIDTVYTAIRDPDGLRAECDTVAAMGYVGKITVHPDQIPIVNDAFSPSAGELAEAEELLALFAENERAGRMAFTFRGQMVDVPHLTRARRVVARGREVAARGG